MLLLCAGPRVSFADEVGPAAQAASTEQLQPPQDESRAVFVFNIATLLAVPVSLGLLYFRRWTKLDGKKLRDRAFEPVVGFGLLILLFAASSIGALLVTRLFIAYDGDLASIPLALKIKASVATLAGMYIGQTVVLIIAWMMLRPRTSSRVPRLHRHSISMPGAVLAGVGALVLFWPLVISAGLAAGELQQWLWDTPMERIAHETLAMLVEAPADGWRTALAALVIIGPGVFEEIFYRGILHRMLRAMAFKPWHAIIITSAIFSIMHGSVVDPRALVALFVLSLGLGWIYERTGRLAAPIAMHMTFNLANLLLALAT